MEKQYLWEKHILEKYPGDKFVIYESHGAKAYTGWANIKSIGKEKTNIIRKYEKKLMITQSLTRKL